MRKAHFADDGLSEEPFCQTGVGAERTVHAAVKSLFFDDGVEFLPENGRDKAHLRSHRLCDPRLELDLKLPDPFPGTPTANPLQRGWTRVLGAAVFDTYVLGRRHARRLFEPLDGEKSASRPVVNSNRNGFKF